MADFNSVHTGAAIDAAVTKVAGIEAGADVTDTANVTAAGALMDSEVTNLAAVKAFDPTDYATAAQGTLADSATQPGDDANTLGSGAATDGYVLTADGLGGAAWEAASGGGGTPGGSDTQVQFNDGGAFGGDSGMTFDKTAKTLTLGGGTLTASSPVIDMAQTWNNSGVAFTGWKLNVTDTASASGSLLMDLQVGGSSKFSVSKGGIIRLGSSATKSAPNFAVSADTGLYVTGSIFGYTSGNYAVVEYNAGWRIYAGGNLGFTSGEANAALDTVLARDAAGALAQRNSTNAQTFNIYNTYDSSTIYERGFMRWNSNVLEIGTEHQNGNVRDIKILDRTGNAMVQSLSSGAGFGYNGTINALMYSNAVRIRNSVQFGWASGAAEGSGFDTSMVRVGAGVIGFRGSSSAAGAAVNFLEQTAPSAPAANQVTIYAEDDGAGKTRLMALFATGVAQQIAIEP